MSKHPKDEWDSHRRTSISEGGCRVEFRWAEDMKAPVTNGLFCSEGRQLEDTLSILYSYNTLRNNCPTKALLR